MQQEVVGTVLNEIAYCLNDVTEEETKKLLEMILQARKVFVAGVGRSGFACRGFAMRLMHMGIEAYFIGDTVTPSFSKEDILIVGSGSGATASLISYTEKAKKLGGNIALLTINPKSPLGRMADISIRLNAPSPKVGVSSKASSIQPMGSMFEQSLMVVCDIIVMELMERLNISEDEMFKRHANLE